MAEAVWLFLFVNNKEWELHSAIQIHTCKNSDPFSISISASAGCPFVFILSCSLVVEQATFVSSKAVFGRILCHEFCENCVRQPSAASGLMLFVAPQALISL
jgi:hypothetical protein